MHERRVHRKRNLQYRTRLHLRSAAGYWRHWRSLCGLLWSERVCMFAADGSNGRHYAGILPCYPELQLRTNPVQRCLREYASGPGQLWHLRDSVLGGTGLRRRSVHERFPERRCVQFTEPVHRRILRERDLFELQLRAFQWRGAILH